MARQPQPTDFKVEVEGVGTFVFGRRTMQDEIQIQREASRIIGGVQPTAWLVILADWMSCLRVLTVVAPEGWDLDSMDPLDEDTYSTLEKVFTALRDKENSFRRKPAARSEGEREATE